MAATFVNSSSVTGSSVTTVTLPKPAGTVDGDLILVNVVAYNSTITATGFTLIDAMVGNQSANHKGNWYYKYASGEGASWAVTFGTATWPIVTAYVLRGLTGAPLNHSTKATAASYVTSMPSAVSTVSSSSDVTVYCYMGVDSGGSGSESITLPVGLSNPISVGNSSVGGIVGVGWAVNAASGATAATCSPDGQDYMCGFADFAVASTVVPFTSTTTWTCPTDVTTAWVRCWGGGGAGGGANTGTGSNGGGGAGGSYAENSALSVSPGTVYTVTVGAAVTGNTSSGSSGNDTWFQTSGTVIAKGGQGGTGNLSTGIGGTGSTTGCIGTTVLAGGNGANGSLASHGGGGGGGAGSTGAGSASSGTTGGAGGTGQGGTGGTGTLASNGNTGSVYGGGGGGAARSSSGTVTGGTGAAGRIEVEYTATPSIKSVKFFGQAISRASRW